MAKKTRGTKSVQVVLPEQAHGELKRIAEEMDVNVSDLFREAVEKYLDGKVVLTTVRQGVATARPHNDQQAAS